MRYLALLRGINVGGNNIIRKQELIDCFQDMGFTNVHTYIQSGNILFRTDETLIDELTDTIEKALSDRFDYTSLAVVYSYEQYVAAVESAPAGWGVTQEERHNALFTLRTITPEQVMEQLPPAKQNIETITPGSGVVFWSVVTEHLTKASFGKLLSNPVYKQVTIRNYNTTVKLLKLFDEI